MIRGYKHKWIQGPGMKSIENWILHVSSEGIKTNNTALAGQNITMGYLSRESSPHPCRSLMICPVADHGQNRRRPCSFIDSCSFLFNTYLLDPYSEKTLGQAMSIQHWTYRNGLCSQGMFLSWLRWLRINSTYPCFDNFWS